MLGSRAQLHWAELDNGIVATVVSWGNYVCHLHNFHLDASMCRGFRSIFDAIQLSFGIFSLIRHLLCMFGLDTLLHGVIIGVKGTTSQGDCYYYEVFEEGRFWQAGDETLIWQTTLQHPVRVVGKSSKTWMLDPSSLDSMLFCQLWAYKKTSSLDLHWDPSNYLWKHPHYSPQTKFFQYSMKFGRS